MGLEGNGPKGKKASGGRFFSSPGWRRHWSSADGSPTSGTSKQSTHLGVLCLLHEKMWDSKGTGLRAKKRPVDAFLVPRAGVGTGAVPTGVPLPAPK